MNSAERIELLGQLAGGGLTISEFAQLDPKDTDSLALLGKVALQTRRHQQAITIFRALQTICRDRPKYGLYLAFAQAEAKDFDAALATVTSYLEFETPGPAVDQVRAYLLRAQLTIESAPTDARQDLQAARAFSEQSIEAKRAFEEMGR